MSDKENDSAKMNQSEEFQTFSKKYKDKNEKSNKIMPSNENNEFYEFTFKKNLFSEKNKSNEKTDNNKEQNNHIENNENDNEQKVKSILNDTNKFKENRHIFKALFQKNNDIKKIEALVTNFYEQKENKSIIISNLSSNRCNNNIILWNKIKKNKKNEKVKSNSVIYNHKAQNKYIASKIKIIHNDNNTFKNHSFISNSNNMSAHNNYTSSYKTKIKTKRKISAKNINISNCFKNNSKDSHKIKGSHHLSCININYKLSTVKNNSAYICINKENKLKEIENTKMSNKSIFTKKKNLTNKNSNIIKLKSRINNKLKIDKSPLSCKNQNRNSYIKVNNDVFNNKDVHLYSNLNQMKATYNSKINSSIIIKKNNTFLNLNKKENKDNSKLTNKNKEKTKLTLERHKIFFLNNKKY
jgi:hypothetical protein